MQVLACFVVSEFTVVVLFSVLFRSLVVALLMMMRIASHTRNPQNHIVIIKAACFVVVVVLGSTASNSGNRMLPRLQGKQSGCCGAGSFGIAGLSSHRFVRNSLVAEEV